jgi:hypothetical protein
MGGPLFVSQRGLVDQRDAAVLFALLRYGKPRPRQVEKCQLVSRVVRPLRELETPRGLHEVNVSSAVVHYPSPERTPKGHVNRQRRKANFVPEGATIAIKSKGRQLAARN